MTVSVRRRPKASLWLGMLALALQAYLPMHFAADWAAVASHLLAHQRSEAVLPHQHDGDGPVPGGHHHHSSDGGGSQCLICGASAGLHTFLQTPTVAVSQPLYWRLTLSEPVAEPKARTSFYASYGSRAPPTSA